MVVVGGLRGGKTRRRDATVTVMHAPRNATRQIARSGCARYPATAALLSVRHSTLSVTIPFPRQVSPSLLLHQWLSSIP